MKKVLVTWSDTVVQTWTTELEVDETKDIVEEITRIKLEDPSGFFDNAEVIDEESIADDMFSDITVEDVE